MKVLQEAVETFSTNYRGEVPSCFNSKKEWATWLTHEEIAHTEPRKFPCRDCTKEYQNRMREAGRCYIPLIRVEKIVRNT